MTMCTLPEYFTKGIRLKVHFSINMFRTPSSHLNTCISFIKKKVNSFLDYVSEKQSVVSTLTLDYSDVMKSIHPFLILCERDFNEEVKFFCLILLKFFASKQAGDYVL